MTTAVIVDAVRTPLAKGKPVARTPRCTPSTSMRSLFAR